MHSPHQQESDRISDKMVSTHRYYEKDESTSFRRHNNRGYSYALSHERELPPATDPYHASRAQHDTRNGSGPDVEPKPRSRITVACGRCRKRKIRCSGDSGTGIPCSNCQGAGNPNCQFLRVSSTETTMRSDSLDCTFDTLPAAPRNTHQCRMNIAPYGHNVYLPPNTSAESYYSRNNSMAAYQLPTRYYGLPNFNEYQEDNIDAYSVNNTNYPIMGSEHLLSSSYPSTSSRGWAPGPQMTKNATVYLEHESNFNHGHLPYHSQSAYSLRTAITPEQKHSTLHGGQLVNQPPMTPPASGAERVLPVLPPPATSTQVNSYVRNSTSGLPVTQGSTYTPVYDGLMTSLPLTSVKSLPSSAISEVSTSSYIPSYASSSPESLSSSQTAYSSSQTLPSSQAGIYPISSSDLYSSEDSAYVPRSEKRQSNASGGEMMSGQSTLANGHHYVPYNSGNGYPAPPMDLSGHRNGQMRRGTGLSAVGAA